MGFYLNKSLEKESKEKYLQYEERILSLEEHNHQNTTSLEKEIQNLQEKLKIAEENNRTSIEEVEILNSKIKKQNKTIEDLNKANVGNSVEQTPDSLVEGLLKILPQLSHKKHDEVTNDEILESILSMQLDNNSMLSSNS